MDKSIELTGKYKELLKLYIDLEREMERSDVKLKKLKARFKNISKRIKISRKEETLNNLYFKGISISDKIADLLIKKSVVSRGNFIMKNFENVASYIHRNDFVSAEKELTIIKNKIANPPLKYSSITPLLIGEMLSQHQQRVDKLFFEKIVRSKPVEIVLDKNIAVISAQDREIETMRSSYLIEKLSKLANKKIETTDIPICATIETDNNYVNLTIIEKEINDKGIVANRHFVRFPNDFIR
ncbi:hypothetical protein KO465_03575 [Candidatus Micrarchaeota archaeon]|nr:hypothetical protein [Candidatus Micrarchaeota archaeon]